MATLTCPKCRGEMHSYERNGVTVDQCADCRGLFLDRGELERLATAEGQWYDRQPADAPAAGRPAPPRQDYPRRYDDDDDRYRSHRHGGYPSHYQGTRKKSFLDDLFG
ncbi:MAG: zf-TFIIB domain-containing protein [Kineosporiaceae bacterium]